MLRALRLLFLAAIALGLITLALANREIVTLHLLPSEAAGFIGFDWSVQVPLFAVGFAGALIGLMIGFVWEWLREHQIRKTATTASRKVQHLEREMDRLKAKDAPKDEVLALLEK